MRRSLRSLAALLAVLGLIGLVNGGCAKKVAVDQIGAMLVGYPEGRRDTLQRTPSDLVVWPDAPNTVIDNFSPGGSYVVYRTGAGAIEGEIFDYLEASGYQLFRRESGGGYRLFNDFVMTPYRRWEDPSYYATAGITRELPPGQFYTFADPQPPAVALAGYVGRAMISGLSGSDYPLTNLGQSAAGGAIPLLNYTGNPAPADSTIPFQWDPVPGASGYWIHVFQTRADIQTGDEAVAIGLPAPVALGKVRDLFIGYVPAPATSYRLGDALPDGGRVLVYRVLQSLIPVLVRVSAVDADGKMIATISTNGDVASYRETIGAEDRLRTFPLGAIIVTPKRPPPPSIATGLRTGAPEAIDSGVPGLTYLRTTATPLRAAR